jgi:hypothetical protein
VSPASLGARTRIIGQPIDVSFRAELRVEQPDPAEEEARLPKLLSLKYSCKNRGGNLTDEHGQIGCALIRAFFDRPMGEVVYI